MKLPAILLLLLGGILMGPVFDWLDPDALFNELLFPIISLSVAVILFEGSLTLKFKELKEHGRMVRGLLSIGMLVTWLIATLVSRLALGLSWEVATLFGAIVVVSGPTVIMPLLRVVRPNANIANILKWEGIVIDPIGALLAVLVFEFIVSGKSGALGHTLWTFSSTLILGISLGGVAGWLLGLALRQHWLPQFLQNAGSLTFMLGVYALSNTLQHESGLLTVTVMGIWMANMRGVPVDDILEFKESLSVLLISGLFIILAARIEFSAIVQLGWGPAWVILALIFVARPLGVWLSAKGTTLSWQEKAFLSWISPRGIVAAAVSALFAFQLENQGYTDAAILVPLVFLVIITTVILQSLTASPIAKWLKVSEPDSSGFLFIGANQVSRAIASVLRKRGIPVMLSDTSYENIRLARMENLPVYFGNPVSEHAENHMDLTGISNVLAISPYRQLNTLATFHYLDLFSKGHVFGLSDGQADQRASHQSSEKFKETRTLFGEKVTYAMLASQLSQGASIRTTQITSEFTLQDYRAQHGSRLLILFVITPQGKLIPVVADREIKAEEGYEIISIIRPDPEKDQNHIADKPAK
ncbi:cation:proton antiporter [Alkalimarinus coralli]|nr:sodium:proton antiporter [Alkalimarinus coralli]